MFISISSSRLINIHDICTNYRIVTRTISSIVNYFILSALDGVRWTSQFSFNGLLLLLELNGTDHHLMSFNFNPYLFTLDSTRGVFPPWVIQFSSSVAYKALG